MHFNRDNLCITDPHEIIHIKHNEAQHSIILVTSEPSPIDVLVSCYRILNGQIEQYIEGSTMQIHEVAGSLTSTPQGTACSLLWSMHSTTGSRSSEKLE